MERIFYLSKRQKMFPRHKLNDDLIVEFAYRRGCESCIGSITTSCMLFLSRKMTIWEL
jgi:hypothetical protein